jgi:hypothetical protein
VVNWTTVELDGLARVRVGGELRSLNPAIGESDRKTSSSSLPVLLEELTITKWPLALEEEQTPGQLAMSEKVAA